MLLQPQQRVDLLDGQQRLLGQFVIDQIEGDWIFGQFTAGPDYPQVEPLFADYQESVNQQLFSVVDELDTAIAALGLHLRSANGAAVPIIQDVQIGAGRITFRIRPSSGHAEGHQQRLSPRTAVRTQGSDADGKGRADG